MITPQERLKQEFELNLQWSRVDVGAALALHVCQWRSSASEQHAQVRVPRVKLVAAVPRVNLLLLWNNGVHGESGVRRAQFAAFGLENLPVRKAMLDLTLYNSEAYREECHASIAESLASVAQALIAYDCS